MSNIEKYRTPLPKKLSQSLVKSLFADVERDDIIQLQINSDNKDVNVKDFAAYLHFIYRIDGLLSKGGLPSYSQRPYEQIRISKIEHGSIELFIERIFSELDVDKLIIIWLVLSYVPKVFTGVFDVADKYYGTMLKREQYLELKDKRNARKEIRHFLNNKPELINLNKKEKGKLVIVLEELYMRNLKRLSSVIRFTDKKVKSVTLKSKRRNDNN